MKCFLLVYSEQRSIHKITHTNLECLEKMYTGYEYWEKQNRVRIFKPFKEPRNDSQPCGPVRTTTLFDELADSIPGLLKRLQIRTLTAVYVEENVYLLLYSKAYVLLSVLT